MVLQRSCLLGRNQGGSVVTARGNPLALRYATASDRAQVYRMRHEIYAEELGQHAVRDERSIQDGLDELNTYVVAVEQRHPQTVVGFVSLTPPTSSKFSLDKYFDRAQMPFLDEATWEVRILTVARSHRGTLTAPFLMLACLDHVRRHKGTSVAAMGRLEILPLYEGAGLERKGLRVTSGAVTFELLHGEVPVLEARAAAFRSTFGLEVAACAWPEASVAPHGGKSFEALGERFDHLDRRERVISADILDAWFDPAPVVVEAVQADLAWLLRSSPPTHAHGLEMEIAERRGVPHEVVLAGGGSSDLIHAALRHWVQPGESVLLPQPTYSEYPFVLGTIGAKLFDIERDGLSWSIAQFTEALAAGPAHCVLVNPNNPTGSHHAVEALLAVVDAHPRTRFWVDETYCDFILGRPTLERAAAQRRNLVVCKSMSKAYALSGARVGYLVGHPSTLATLRAIGVPWSVGAVAQLAAIRALGAEAYYEVRWERTAALREALAEGLRDIGWQILGGEANFLLVEAPDHLPEATIVCEELAEVGLHVRSFAGVPRLSSRTLRIAVKDAWTNQRMLDILRAADKRH